MRSVGHGLGLFDVYLFGTCSHTCGLCFVRHFFTSFYYSLRPQCLITDSCFPTLLETLQKSFCSRYRLGKGFPLTDFVENCRGRRVEGVTNLSPRDVENGSVNFIGRTIRETAKYIYIHIRIHILNDTQIIHSPWCHP